MYLVVDQGKVTAIKIYSMTLLDCQKTTTSHNTAFRWLYYHTLAR